MQSSVYHIDAEYAQLAHRGYHCCGDVINTHRVPKQGRVVAALSDGLGSGPIANVLASLTVSMALRFALDRQDVERAACTIMDTLPKDSVKALSYATFIIVDVESDGEARVVEFDNPPVMLFRNGVSAPMPRQARQVLTKVGDERMMHVSRFYLKPNDRLVLLSDGVTQSGMGQPGMPFGFGQENVQRLVGTLLRRNEEMSAHDLSRAVVQRACRNDMMSPQDDISCAVVHFRAPRRLLVCTGPPFTEAKDGRMVESVRDFPGAKVVCGGTTAQIISRGLGVALSVVLGKDTDGLPPTSQMAGIDLVTEGVLTLSRVVDILHMPATAQESDGKGPAWAIVRMLLGSDLIHFLVGTRINISHYDPALPIELEARRTLVRRLVRELVQRYNKEVTVEYM